MTDSNLSRNVLDEIKKKHITPKPRWEFLLKDSAVWTAGIACLIIGGLATSVIIYMLRNDDLDALSEAGEGTVDVILIALPYFWILTLAAFILIAHYNFKHTKGGYRYRIPTVAVAVVFISAVLGVFFYDIGAGRAIDLVLSDKVPTYQRFLHPRARMWSRPEKGIIAGTVVEITDSLSFRMRDLRDKDWIVLTRRPVPMPPPLLQQGMKVRCLGRPVEANAFEADLILPWESPLKPIFFMRIMNERIPNDPAY